MLSGSILITGGAGTLGRAIIHRATQENWPCKITIFSRDAIKHAYVRGLYPHVNSVIGDIRDDNTLYNAMAGKDIVIHAAAVKHIPVSEMNSVDTYEINVIGSLNVCAAAVQHGTKHVLGISTDKACHSANAYGSTKYMMEKTFQEYARIFGFVNFHLVRYGNVLESTGSVVEIWRRAQAEGRPIGMTDPAMTRFYISPAQAVQYVLDSLRFESGQVYIPKMKALSLEHLAEYVLEEGVQNVKRMSLRPGEKIHECLLTTDEAYYAKDMGNFFVLNPTISQAYDEYPNEAYTSDKAPKLSKKELLDLLDE